MKSNLNCIINKSIKRIPCVSDCMYFEPNCSFIYLVTMTTTTAIFCLFSHCLPETTLIPSQFSRFITKKMSHTTYDQEWRKAQDLLASTLSSEPTQAERRQQRKQLATLYVRYIMVANKLSVCVDQIVQPQKRALIRKLLEAVLGRILELKTDLVEADLNEWSHLGEIIGELNVTPLQCEIQVPRCFINERRKELAYKKKVIDTVLDKLGFLEKVKCRRS